MGVFDERQFLEDYRLHPESAFRQLMDAFRDRVYLLCLRAAGQRQPAEDLAQETFIRIWKGLAQFRGESSLATWIYHITWNVCASFIDKKSSAQGMPSVDDEDAEGREMDMNLSIYDANIKTFENRQFISTLLAKLPAPQQLVLTLFYLQELTYEEMSSVTGWPLGTVKATLHRAKDRMRALAFKELQIES